MSQQYAKPKAKTFNRNYVTVTHLKAANIKAAARSSALNARTGVSCWQRNIGPDAGLSGCDLAGAYLGNAGLQRANMTDTDIRGSFLGSTNMSGTELAGSDVTGSSSGGITGTPATLPTGWNIVNGVLVPTSAPTLNQTVTFDNNTGTGSMSPQVTNVATALTANTFTKAGFSFAGWGTAVGGPVVYADSAVYPFSATKYRPHCPPDAAHTRCNTFNAS